MADCQRSPRHQDPEMCSRIALNHPAEIGRHARSLLPGTGSVFRFASQQWLVMTSVSRSSTVCPEVDHGL